jgi:hypothetical protein
MFARRGAVVPAASSAAGPVAAAAAAAAAAATTTSSTLKALSAASSTTATGNGGKLTASEKAKVDKALAARYYLLAQHGPMSFMVGVDAEDETRRFTVKLGAQTCSCLKPHCTHLLFVMLRVLKVCRRLSSGEKEKGVAVDSSSVSFFSFLFFFFFFWNAGPGQ